MMGHTSADVDMVPISTDGFGDPFSFNDVTVQDNLTLPGVTRPLLHVVLDGMPVIFGQVLDKPQLITQHNFVRYKPSRLSVRIL